MDLSWEFMELVEEIAEDGELRFSEIRRLTEWIQANRAAREFWPVDEFVGLLVNVYRDGKIEKEEARRVGHLIQKVRREWARRHASDQPIARKELSELLSDFDPSVALLPKIPLEATVTDTVDGNRYFVNLDGPTCSCSGFRAKRAALPAGHLSRCCHHIQLAYAQFRPEHGWPDWMDAFLEVGFQPTPGQKWSVLKLPNGFHLVSSASPEWGNIYFKSNGENRRFSYNVMDQRWSYREKPDNADRLASEILRLTDET